MRKVAQGGLMLAAALVSALGLFSILTWGASRAAVPVGIGLAFGWAATLRAADGASEPQQLGLGYVAWLAGLAMLIIRGGTGATGWTWGFAGILAAWAVGARLREQSARSDKVGRLEQLLFDVSRRLDASPEASEAARQAVLSRLVSAGRPCGLAELLACLYAPGELARRVQSLPGGAWVLQDVAQGAMSPNAFAFELVRTWTQHHRGDDVLVGLVQVDHPDLMHLLTPRSGRGLAGEEKTDV